MTFGQGMKVEPISLPISVCTTRSWHDSEEAAHASANAEIDEWIKKCKAAGLKNWVVRIPYELVGQFDYDRKIWIHQARFRAVAF